MAPTKIDKPTILVTGASGYIGGRLIHHLDSSSYRIRCLARKPEYLLDRVPESAEIVSGDVLDESSLIGALEGVDTAYYLVHAMGSSGDFEKEERRGAANFARAAKTRGVRRIVYLGGLGDSSEQLSPHLRSRHRVGDVLRSAGVEVIELRASIVIGSGSLSFELVRALTERLPVMLTPRWVSVPAQPIAIADLLAYLTESLNITVDGNRIFDIGGQDIVSYSGIMREYARQRHLKRTYFPVPVLTPGLSSRWLGLVTPVYARIGRKLIDSVKHPTIVRDDSASRVFDISPMSLSEAIAAALTNEDREFAVTRWSDALSSVGSSRDWGGVRFGNRLVDSRTTTIPAPRSQIFSTLSKIGGQTGWYHADWLWRIRGWMDLLAGGAGLRRGRRDPNCLRVGDVLDFWRISDLTSDRFVRLESEMKTPGRAWLEFELEDHGKETRLRQTAIFDPTGLTGLLYWYALYPVHHYVFDGMLRGIAADVRLRFGADRNG
ncbi:MAG: SDR family oxidoreductase [Candidatus Latescibacterota bacterium]|nr:MAG: SDR family oxidoreductase [Candidatus Latescibacterota bacterium]